MQRYEGVLTADEYAEAQRLRKELSSSILFLMFGESAAVIGEPGEHHAGRLSDEVLETRIAGHDGRIPWQAVTAYAHSANVVLLLIGQHCLPIARSFFPSETEWKSARNTFHGKVPIATPSLRFRDLPANRNTVMLWLALLVVIFIAWHFAQMPGAR
jgi:hypothetical protein